MFEVSLFEDRALGAPLILEGERLSTPFFATLVFWVLGVYIIGVSVGVSLFRIRNSKAETDTSIALIIKMGVFDFLLTS